MIRRKHLPGGLLGIENDTGKTENPFVTRFPKITVFLPL
jgi:hypothetical protein